MTHTPTRPRIAVIMPFTGLVVGGLCVMAGGGLFALLVVTSSGDSGSDGSATFGLVIGGLVATVGFMMLVVGLVRLLNAVFDVLVEARERLDAP